MTISNFYSGPWNGRIVMLTQEASGPYDRTILSKQMTKTAEELLLRKPPFYQEHGIELVTESKVVGMDTKVMNNQSKFLAPCFQEIVWKF